MISTLEKVFYSLFFIMVTAWLGVFLIQRDTYTAVVVSPPFLDTDEGKTGKFIRLKPQHDKYLWGKDDQGDLKLAIKDSRIPYLAWSTNGERADRLKEGQIICVTERGFRNDFFSQYPIFVNFTHEACKE